MLDLTETVMVMTKDRALWNSNRSLTCRHGGALRNMTPNLEGIWVQALGWRVPG